MRPETEAELAALIRAGRGPLSIIGGGTRLLPGEGQGTRLPTAALTGVTLYEPAALTLVARAGTPLAEIEALLASERQRLAFEPPPAPGSTIGGVIAANASGPRRVKDGAARDSLLGVRFVDGGGKIVSNGGRVMKNVTGYDLVKLMAGSRGTLGVLTEVSLKIQPIPPFSLTLALPELDAAAAVPALTAALTGPWDVTGAAWLPDLGALVRIEGLEGSVELRAETLTARLSAFGEVQSLKDDPWLLLRGNIPGSGAAPRSGSAIWRIACRPSQTAAILTMNPDATPLALDWGASLIFFSLAPNARPALPQGARALCLQGTHRGPLPPPDPVTRRLEDGLRERFDPRGIFAAPELTVA
ncbi:MULTISPECIES: FAD-binding protein [unclassified Paracoccus (in: a-proteobacteria)]|uniref:FAD-binding protein n=1 Tax=unclassified Paracoccus (in: a-proteobacteria) TaxID=2688777 RepID=UPI0016049FE7|nr:MULTISPECIES: FAD-binding protein [unclassified Paracoccus (in: a-proteobacteria)]MBB1491749.1 FAD-binding protein [Paracoccus sp. MC1854]MBB1496844.1 FAD-binding protein [Paracoccus sp. MC1862]QQO45471.1 FAD-binding protein [Paracoccus sp. MC1862]